MEKVLLRRAPEYNPEIIQKIITEGMDELGIKKTTRENITIKPNVVMAHHKLAPSAFTRPEFIDGLLRSLHTLQGPGSKTTITEKTGWNFCRMDVVISYTPICCPTKLNNS